MPQQPHNTHKGFTTIAPYHTLVHELTHHTMYSDIGSIRKHSFLRSIRQQMGLGFHKKLRALRLKRNLRLIRIIERKKTPTHKTDNTCNLPPELVDDLSGRCYVLNIERGKLGHDGSNKSGNVQGRGAESNRAEPAHE